MMNRRIAREETPEGRIARAARILCDRTDEKYKHPPDYADFRDALRPFIVRELLLARIDEARRGCGIGLTERVRGLAEELATLEETLPNEILP
jgi:hypothetical protein